MTCPPARLVRLHFRSRRGHLTIILLSATAGVLRAVKPWTEATSELGTRLPYAALLPLVLAAAAAALVAAGTRSPMGEPERATNPLPPLRLLHAMILVGLAVGLLGAARIGDDPLATMRNIAGLSGLALIAASLIGAALAWIVPLAYVLSCWGAIDVQEVTLWSWAALPSSDAAATQVALLLLAAGLAMIVLSGTRDHHTDPD